MRILVACEVSGVVRDTLRAEGHNAISCDLLPSMRSNRYHIQADVRTVLDDRWDMMIAFPPCTHLCSSGARHWPGKITEQLSAIDFFMWLAGAPIKHVCIENPVGIMSTRWRKPDQIIQPWQFGHDASKRTCLWLRELPHLVPTDVIYKKRYANQTPSGQNKLGPSKDRALLRSITYQGIADAMALQWGGL